MHRVPSDRRSPLQVSLPHLEDADIRRRTEAYVLLARMGMLVSLPVYGLAALARDPIEAMGSIGITTGIILGLWVATLVAQHGWVDLAASVMALGATAFFLVFSAGIGEWNPIVLFPVGFSVVPLAVLSSRAQLLFGLAFAGLYAGRVAWGPPTTDDLALLASGGTLWAMIVAVSVVQNRGTATALRALESANKQSQVRMTALEEATRQRDIFLANVSHELRTPLNAILGYAELAEEELSDVLDDPPIDDLQRIQRSGRHLLDLVDDLLDLSRLRAGEVHAHPAELAIDGLLTEVLDSVRPLADANGTTLKTHQTGGPTFVSDRRLLVQVLVNLVGNAVKFSPGGEVALIAAVRDDRLTVQVSDTGIGMNAEELGRVREVFSQANAQIGREFGGAGLGLAIVDRLCTVLGGTLVLDSEPGVGTTATVTLEVATTG